MPIAPDEIRLDMHSVKGGGIMEIAQIAPYALGIVGGPPFEPAPFILREVIRDAHRLVDVGHELQSEVLFAAPRHVKLPCLSRDSVIQFRLTCENRILTESKNCKKGRRQVPSAIAP